MTAVSAPIAQTWSGSQPLNEAASLAGGLAFLRRRWPVMLVTLVATLVLTAAVLHAVPPRFTARAEILLDPHGEKPFGPDNTLRLINLDTADLDSAVTLIRGGALLGRVVAAQTLNSDPEFVSTLRMGATHPGWWPHRTIVQPLPAEGQAAAALWRALKVERVGKSFALALIVTSLDPVKAARLANAVAEAYVGDRREARLDASRRAASYFADRLAPLAARLKLSEDALEQFRRSHDLLTRTVTQSGADGNSTVSEQRLTELNSRLAAAQGETAQAWARLSDAHATALRGGAIDALPDVLRSPLIAQLRQQQADVARREADLAARYTDRYPLLVNVRAERREIERTVAREIARILATLQNAYDTAKSQEDSLRAALATTATAAGLDNDLGPQLRALERQKLVDQTLFEAYLGKAREAEQQTAFEDHDARVISPAVVPTVPAFPQRGLCLALMSAFGLGLGCAIALCLEALAPGFTDPVEAEAVLGYRVLAAVPWLCGGRGAPGPQAGGPARLIADRPASPFAEAVQSIRAGVHLSAGVRDKVVLVASASAGEGRTLVALSLALVAARAGQRVLLVDGDRRMPGLSRFFGVDYRLGLSDLLGGLVGTTETTVPVGTNLAIMPAGRRSGAAPDLFASGRMARYLTHVRAHYDLVIVDAAPTSAVADGRLLAELCDRIVFLVGWRSTARALAGRELRSLAATGKVVGVVLNKVGQTSGLFAWTRAIAVRRRPLGASA